MIVKNLLASIPRGTYSHAAGCDEAGRGALAGPVVAACVVWDITAPSADWHRRVRDSKLVPPKEREELYGYITSAVAAWGVASRAVSDIERLNIHRATLEALRDAVLAASVSVPSGSTVELVVDGKFGIERSPWPQRAVVDADATHFAVAAASILAKVTRDRLLVQLGRQFPGYGFEQHKGYGTKQHAAAIRDLGMCDYHRPSFCTRVLAG